MSETRLTERVADYALNLRYEALPAEVIDRAKQLLLDFLGVALGARVLAPSTPALVSGVRALSGGAGGPSGVLGASDRYQAHYAALLNAALAHSMDFDDTHRESIMHIGTPLFAALLAVGEQTNCSAEDFLTAAVAGYEIGAKLGLAHGDRVHLRGFHPTATTGIFGVTAAAGRLLGLDQPALESALGLALSMSAGSQQFAEGGGANKPFQVGMTAHNAVYALVLAQEGLVGTRQPLEGRLGYYATFAEPGSDLSAIDLDLEAPCEVLKVGIKPYPCCRYSHGTIDGVLVIAAREGLGADDIESIEVALPAAGFQLVGAGAETKRRPESVVDAQFSVYFAAAAAATCRSYSWDCYAMLKDAALERLMDRITARSDPSLSSMATRLTVRSKRGTSSLDIPFPKGEPEVPLGWEEVEAKFLDLSGRVLGKERTHAVSRSVRELERIGQISELAKLLRP